MRVLTDIAEYQKVVGTTFHVQAGPTLTLPLRLDEVKVAHDTEVQFTYSLFFTAPPPLVGQYNYAVNHEQLGDLHIFLVPIGQVPGGFRYQAVFNLLKASPVASS